MKRLLFAVLGLLLVCAPASAQSPSCTTVALGQTQDITAFSVCKRVTLASVPAPDAVSICVPTNIDAAQWQSFYDNPPPGVTVEECATGCTGYSYAGYCYATNAGAVESCDAICAARGGCSLAGTRHIGSDDSSGARCSAVVTGITGTAVIATTSTGYASGCAALNIKGGWMAGNYYNPTTTCAAADLGGRVCACQGAGSLYCWGYNGLGQLGDGSTTERHTPAVALGGYTDWLDVAGGQNHACGLRSNGTIYCWGGNVNGELGDGTTTNRVAPTLISGGFTDWAEVAAGMNHTCARRTNGAVYCWGDNSSSQLGDGTSTSRSIPTLVSGGFTDWTEVTAGQWHSCGRRAADNRIYCWGSNLHGQLGDGTTTDRTTPRYVSANWSEVDAGGHNSCARSSSNGRLYCWGYNGQGQVGVTPSSPYKVLDPTQVSNALTDWAQVSTGAQHSCARRSGGAVYCWGSGNSGRLGNGGTGNQSTPVQESTSRTWSSISAGATHTCARDVSGDLYCWGANSRGQLGDGTTTIRLTATPLSAVLAWEAVGASVASDSTCAIVNWTVSH